jgi:hypothetical protein
LRFHPVLSQAPRINLVSSRNQTSRAGGLLIAACGVVALAFWWVTARATGGNLLNGYLFVNGDGYDYLLHGFVFSQWVQGAPLVELPVLRNPVFVLATFLDYLLGGSGVAAMGVIALALFVMLASVVLAARWVTAPMPETAVVLWSVVVSPLAFFRSYILSDLLASALMVLAVALLVRYQVMRRHAWLILAGVAGIGAGLTQFYGLVPFLVVGGWVFLATFRERKPDWAMGAALLGSMALTVGLLLVWRMAIPHDTVPPVWELFELSSAMAAPYLHFWVIAFGGMLPVFLWLVLRRWRVILLDPLVLGCWLAVIALAIGTFLYQWEDFRFTHSTAAMFAMAVVVSLKGQWQRSKASIAVFAASAVLVTVIGLGMAPTSYWFPRVGELDFAPDRTWLADLLRAEEIDRFGVPEHCGEEAVFCEAVALPNDLDPYQRLVLTAFGDAAES